MSHLTEIMREQHELRITTRQGRPRLRKTATTASAGSAASAAVAGRNQSDYGALVGTEAETAAPSPKYPLNRIAHLMHLPDDCNDIVWE